MIATNKHAGEFLPPSELILNDDGSVYHLKLKPDQIADKIIVVGDQQRVKLISSFFDTIDCEVQNREFCTHTGWFNNTRITAISSGIGTDNIDITLNELDALVNIDLINRRVKSDLTSLDIVRIGTCGGLQAEVEPGDFVLSQYGFGLDGMLNYYDVDFTDEEIELNHSLKNYLNLAKFGIQPYISKASNKLTKLLSEGMHKGITITANGFYAPQGRSMRLGLALPGFNDLLETYKFNDLKVLNYEMETSALFGLGGSMGHNCSTVCVAVANRPTKKALVNYKPKVTELVELVLDRLTN